MRVTDEMVRSWLVWGRNYGEIVSFEIVSDRGRKWRITLPAVVLTASGMQPGFIERDLVPTELMFTSREALAFGMGLAAAGARPETRHAKATRDWAWEEQANQAPSSSCALASRDKEDTDGR